MAEQVMRDVIQLLDKYSPGWVIALAVCCIVAWRLPKIIEAIKR